MLYTVDVYNKKKALYVSHVCASVCDLLSVSKQVDEFCEISTLEI
jgi:hypothetical protein